MILSTLASKLPTCYPHSIITTLIKDAPFHYGFQQQMSLDQEKRLPAFQFDSNNIPECSPVCWNHIVSQYLFREWCRLVIEARGVGGDVAKRREDVKLIEANGRNTNKNKEEGLTVWDRTKGKFVRPGIFVLSAPSIFKLLDFVPTKILEVAMKLLGETMGLHKILAKSYTKLSPHRLDLLEVAGAIEREVAAAAKESEGKVAESLCEVSTAMAHVGQDVADTKTISYDMYRYLLRDQCRCSECPVCGVRWSVNVNEQKQVCDKVWAQLEAYGKEGWGGGGVGEAGV